MQQILSHTPLYVWAILAFLVYRGVLATAQRELTLRKLCIIPLVMLALSIQGIYNSFGVEGAAPLLWLAGFAVGGALAWRSVDTRRISVDVARSTIVLPGSWGPLVLMVALFCLKYAVGVSLAMQPALKLALPFMVTVCTLYGLFSGIFAGALLRRLDVYRRAHGAGMVVTA